MAADGLDLREAVIFLAGAGLVVPVMHRLKISPVLGFLAVGLLFGPEGLGRLTSILPPIGTFVISDLDGVRALGELGVMALLFMIGLELSLARLLAMRRPVFGLGGAQVVLTATFVSLVAFAFGNTGPASVVLGGCLALSSTAIVMQLLVERGSLGSPVGQTSFAILLFQDLAVVPILFLVGVLAIPGDGGGLAGDLALALGKAMLAIVAIFVAGRLVVRPILRLVVSTGSRELFLAAVLLAGIGTAAATQAAGLSLALGAFLAGLLLAETEYHHQVAVDLEPFKGLLLGLFFVSVGLGIGLDVVAAHPVWILASVAGLFAVKALIMLPLARAFGIPAGTAVETALLLGQGGEFAFVIIGLAQTSGILPEATAQFMVLVAGLSMVATPAVAALARRLGQHIRVKESAAGLPADALEGLSGHVVIAGYGRVGQMLGSLLDAQQIPHVAVDLDAQTVAAFQAKGAGVVYGDASHPDFLRRVGIERAAALVVTMDRAVATERIVVAVRAAAPALPIYARARDGLHARRLMGAGATDAVPETVEASLELGQLALIGLGLPLEAARQIVDERRESERARLRLQPEAS